jgi:hypothetical protein
VVLPPSGFSGGVSAGLSAGISAGCSAGAALGVDEAGGLAGGAQPTPQMLRLNRASSNSLFIWFLLGGVFQVQSASKTSRTAVGLSERISQSAGCQVSLRISKSTPAFHQIKAKWLIEKLDVQRSLGSQGRFHNPRGLAAQSEEPLRPEEPLNLSQTSKPLNSVRVAGRSLRITAILGRPGPFGLCAERAGNGPQFA